MAKKKSPDFDKKKFIDKWMEKNLSTKYPPPWMITTTEDAFHEANEYNDFSKLEYFLVHYPDELAKNIEANKLIASKLKEATAGSIGNVKIEKKYCEIRNYQILRMIYFFIGYGLPEYSKGAGRKKKETACSKAMEGIIRMGFEPLEEEAVISVWRAHKKGKNFNPPWERYKPKCTPIWTKALKNNNDEEKAAELFLDMEYFRGEALKKINERKNIKNK